MQNNQLKNKTQKNNEMTIWKRYKNTDIRALRKSKNLTGNDLAKKINISSSCISYLELKKCKRVNQTMIRTYNYFKTL